MSGSPRDDQPASREVVLILRLMLDRQDRLRHGTLLDAEATVLGSFVDLDRLADAVGRSLAGRAAGATPGPKPGRLGARRRRLGARQRRTGGSP